MKDNQDAEATTARRHIDMATRSAYIHCLLLRILKPWTPTVACPKWRPDWRFRKTARYPESSSLCVCRNSPQSVGILLEDRRSTLARRRVNTVLPHTTERGPTLDSFDLSSTHEQIIPQVWVAVLNKSRRSIVVDRGISRTRHSSTLCGMLCPKSWRWKPARAFSRWSS